MMGNIDFNTETDIDIREINKIIDQHIRHAGALITILQSVQEKYSYLPRTALEEVSKRLQVPTSRVFHVATFYKAFSLEPKGKHLSTVCLGTACHVRGAKKIASEFERQLSIKAGETTPDREFTLETVNCVGACALGPVVVVDGKYFPHSTKENVKEIIGKYRKGLDKEDFRTDRRIFPVEVYCPFCNHSLMDPDHPVDGIASIRVIISFGSKKGWLRLSSYFGSYTLASQQEVPIRTVVKFSCPHCHEEIAGTSSCVECDAPMIPMTVRGGGILQVCSRRGCKGHMLDLSYIKYP